MQPINGALSYSSVSSASSQFLMFFPLVVRVLLVSSRAISSPTPVFLTSLLGVPVSRVRNIFSCNLGRIVYPHQESSVLWKTCIFSGRLSIYSLIYPTNVYWVFWTVLALESPWIRHSPHSSNAVRFWEIHWVLVHSFSKYLLNESSWMGSVLCVGVKTVSKDRHGPS